MAITADFHLHSYFSGDSDTPMEQMILKGLELGLTQMCFTEHNDFDFPVTEEEMKKQLGLPIFYRIDKMIHFNDFDHSTIYEIVKNEIEAREDEYKDKLTSEMVYAAVSPFISTSGENARTIKYKVQQVIEELLFQEVVKELLQ